MGHTTSPRELNDKQINKLDEINKVDPNARVVGWATMGKTGPIVRSSNGMERIVNITGRTVKNDQVG